MMFSIFIIVVVFARWGNAEPTSSTNIDHINLQKRSITTICGYGIDDPTYSFVCDGGYVCGFNPTSKAFGCCASASGSSAYNCYFPTTCYDYGKLTFVPTGSSAYFTYSCSDLAYPYCATIIENGMINFDCNKYMSQTAYLNFAANITTTIISSSSSPSTTGGNSPSPSPSLSASVTPSSTITSSTSDSTVAVVGSISTAPSFSRTQATGSVTSTSTTSSGYRTYEMTPWTLGLICSALLSILT